MVQLLQLPLEMFEAIIGIILTSADATIVYRGAPASSQEQRAALGGVLALRLVHSRFRALIDPLVFKKIVTLLGTCTLKRASKINLLLAFPLVARHVKELQIAVQEEADDFFGPIVDVSDGLLQHTERLASLFIWNPIRPSKPLRTGTITTRLHNLKELEVRDRSFIMSLPQLLQAAPAMDSLTLGPFGSLDAQLLLAATAKEWAAVPKIERPLRSLRLYLTNSCELRIAALLGFRPIELAIDFFGTSRFGSFEVVISDIVELSAGADFRTFGSSIVPKNRHQGTTYLLDQRQCAIRRQELLNELKVRWEGRGITMVSDQPVENYLDLVEQAGPEGSPLSTLLVQHVEYS